MDKMTLESTKIKIDKKDKQIIYELESNCRRSLNVIAKKVGLSKQSLHYKIERLVREGAIIQFITVFDYSKMGYTNNEVWFQLREMTVDKRKGFVEYLKKHPQIRWLVTCGGKFDHAMAIMAPDIVTFSNILKEILAEYPNAVQNHFITISKEIVTYPRTHLLERQETEKRRGNLLFSSTPEKRDFNQIELRIMSVLSANARVSTVELARLAKTTPKTVRSKIKQFEKEGIVQGYRAVIQPSKIGFENYEVLIATQSISKEKEKELETYCKTNPYVTFLLHIIGRWDLDIAFDAKDGHHFQEILTEIRTRFGDLIREFEYAEILHVYKFDYSIPLTGNQSNNE
ncbi:Lrp/AsnC family transcriptional regulator [Candidatus Micrarchaeota archaeon]|nr:Lrp/AsnC family transcriptional regulator [Candidatus Micrarchaeota archaeon]